MSRDVFQGTVAGKKYQVLKLLGSISGSVHMKVRRRRHGLNGRINKRDYGKTFHLKMSFVHEISLMELRITRHLKHDNVIRLYETLSQRVTNDMRFMYMIMEDCRANLSLLLQQYPPGPFNYRLIKSIMHHLLQGVIYLHTNNVAHYNLTPQTVLIDYDHTQINKPLDEIITLKISDFGRARLVNESYVPLPELINGAIAYASPEVIRARKIRRFVKAADMWAVGCMFGEFFTRSLLFPISTQKQQLKLLKSWTESLEQPNECISFSSRVVHRIFVGMEMKINNCSAFHLLDRFFEPNPDYRIKAINAVHHPYLMN